MILLVNIVKWVSQNEHNIKPYATKNKILYYAHNRQKPYIWFLLSKHIYERN